MERKRLAIDFDGTCVKKAKFPAFGDDNEFAVRNLQALAKDGIELILWTCRDNDALLDAVAWFEKHNIPLSGINSDVKCVLFERSVKIDVDYYIDDKALGCPLLDDGSVDWYEIYEILLRKGYTE